jgi:Trk-type K+ transport system membrane component
MSDEPDVSEHLESLGESQVRLLLLTGGLPGMRRPAIIKWLTEKEREERRRNEASQIEQNQIALSAKKAAWIAAIAAIVAAIVAIIGAVISWLAWIWPQVN